MIAAAAPPVPTLPPDLADAIIDYLRSTSAMDGLAALRAFIHEASPVKAMPVDFVRWVPIDQVTPNDYNPNSVARIEMGLLATSIRHDGYTQPVVTFWDESKGQYIIIDGFHRYWTMRTNEDILAATGGYLPIVVIEKSLADRMASTVRHNRARGKHAIGGMANLVFGMLENGKTDSEVCAELGMEAEELVRLKYVTGFAKLFDKTEYRRSWKNERQIIIEREYAERLRREAEADATSVEATV